MENILKSTCQLFFSVLLSVFLVIPIFSIKFGWNEIRRIFVTVYFKLTGNAEQFLDGADGVHACSSRALVRILCVFKGNADFEKLKELFNQRIIQRKNPDEQFKYKKLRSYLTTKAGYSCWKLDSKFELKNHFRTLLENAVETEEKLMDFIQQLDAPLPQDRPQWEIIFLPRLPSPNESGLLLLMHHSYGDGLSIINTLAEQLSSERPFPYVINPVTFKAPFWSKLFFMIKGYAFFSWTFFNSIRNPPKISEDCHPAEKDSTICHNARFDLSLTQLKSIQKNTNGSTFSAIFLTATQNALDNINKKRVWLNSCVVVAKLPYPKAEFCNRISPMNAVVSEPELDGQGRINYLAQLQEVNRATRVRSNLTFFVNDTMTRLFGRLPSTIKQNTSFGNILLISNIPFTSRPFDLDSEIIKECFVWPVCPKSIMVSSLSVGNRMNVTIGAGSNILSKEELGLVVEEIKNQMNLMEAYDGAQTEDIQLSWV